ncbi:BTAD domain-containing putative transcriptional regulator [Spirillospora sp. NPDC047279]|uniref:BTAD domain-containing putative transcriptional regulator n=1 Tax=Spirillospora sp. NPDC047279 TaxID=3155478 RepID=UPI0033EAC04C
MSGVTFGVLGPLVAGGEGGPIDLKGPRHRAVLARLLVAGGRVVPVSRLIDDLWTVPPGNALGAVQTFVGALRKALEPDRPPRTPARLLVTAAPGYAIRTDPANVDAWRFEAAVRAAAGAPSAAAFERLDEALGWWRGPAYAEFADEGWARGEALRLDGLRLLAVERRAEAALATGRAALAVPDLEGHVKEHPRREDGWRLLALALYRTGRQADALAALRQARDYLDAELGLDPTEGLRRLESDILRQSPGLLAGAPAAAEAPAAPAPAERVFVGRAAELAELERSAGAAVAAGRPVLALVSGDAGAGKTALTETLAERLEARGWTTRRGIGGETYGEGAEEGADPAEARFRRHRAVAARLAGRTLLVLDDLHWAGEETLALMTALAADPAAGPVLIVGTYRSTEVPAVLTEALGRAARAEPVRIYLTGLAEREVAALAGAMSDTQVTPEEARRIHRRSGGNPFFVRELTRLLDAGGALDEVPAGVRDVVRRRLGRLPERARTVLRQAAVVGDDVDLDVLIPLAGDEDTVLDAAEEALLGGFLAEPDADRLRFAHALVREVLYDEVPRARRARWHARIAEILEDAHPGRIEPIAHHLVQAGSRATAARAARYARAAAERAERRVAPHEAARWWRAAADAEDDARLRLEATMGLVRALAVTGDLDGARRLRADATAAAERLGDPLLTARVIGSFDVPANWTTTDDPALSAGIAAAAERTLAALPAGHDAERARLLATVALELRADAGPRGGEAAAEAEEIARGLADPALLAFALNARYLQSFRRAGLAPERARIGAELAGLAAAHGLATFEVLGHLILVQAHAALADLTAADEHAATADRLAERYELPLVGVFTAWYAALRQAVSGRTAEAEDAYRRAAARLAGSGMPGVEDGMLPLALLSLRLQDGTPPADLAGLDFGPYEAWARPLILAAQGRDGEARAAAAAVPESPRDLLFEARTCLHLRSATDPATRRRLRDELRPAAGELAGAGSGMVTFGPVAGHLDEAGHPDEDAPA